MAFALKYPGTCNCGRRLSAGSMATYSSGRITSCGACSSAQASSQPGSKPSPRPAARSSYKVPAAPTCASPAEATENLAALLAKLDSDQSIVASWKPEQGNARVVAAAGCHRKGQEILMYDGSIKLVEDIIVGDKLMGPDSKPRTVSTLCRGRQQMVEVKPTKGEAFVVNLDHVLTIVVSGARGKNRLQDLTARSLLASTPYAQGVTKLVRTGVEFVAAATTLPVDPYFIGVLLGDGSLTSRIAISKPGEVIAQLAREQAAVWGLQCQNAEVPPRCPIWRLSVPLAAGGPGKNPLTNVLRSLGLYPCATHERFVPQSYLVGAKETRAAVLAGLIDTDGSISRCGVDFISKSQQLSKDVTFLARSLGLAAYLTPCQKYDQNGHGGTHYRVSISGSIAELPLRVRTCQPRRQIKSVLRTGFKLNKLGVESYYGFTLDGDGRYLLGDFTITHNSGKTTTLVALVAKLLAEGMDPEGIVVTTFTNKAAAELTERLAKVMTSETLKALRVGTFHALALKGLRGAGQTWDMDYCVDTRGSALAVAGRLLMTCIVGDASDKPIKKLSVSGHGMSPAIAGCYSQLIDCLRSDGHTVADYRSNKRVLIEQLDGVETVNGLKAFESVWKTYEAAKKEQGGWDFADALAAYLNGLRDGTVADGAQIVFVDEAQDNSNMQIELARELAGSSGKVILIGDARQAIFRFRGADPELFITADTTINAKTLQIRNNYRSGREIVAIGNRVAEGKPWSLGDPAVAARGLDGVVKTMGSNDPESEAEAIAREIAIRMERDSTSPSDFAVLARTNWEIGLVESACYRAKVPLCVAGGSSFFASRDVQDFIAMLTVARCEHLGQACSDDKLFLRLVKRAEHLGIEYARAVERLRGATCYLPAMTAAAQVLDKRRKAAAAHLHESIAKVADGSFSESCAAASSWLMEMHDANAAAAEAAGETIEDATGMARSIFTIAGNFDDLVSFVKYTEDCARDTASIGENDTLPVARVTLSTLHKSKGREFRIVYLLATNGRFPHPKAKSDEGAAGEERLFYVGVTRAKDELVLSSAEHGWKNAPAGPSIFFAYLDDAGGPDDGGKLPMPKEQPQPAGQLAASNEADAKARALARHIESMRQPFTPQWVEADKVEELEQMAADADALDDPAVAAQLIPPAPVVPAPTAASGWTRGAILKELAHVAARVATEPAPKPADGSRYVQPQLVEVEKLLASINAQRAACDVEEGAGQVVFEVKVEQTIIRIFTTIEIGDAGARGVGEDSIKVSCLQATGANKPVLKKAPYAQRTRGWRATLVKKLVEVVEKLGPVCLGCGSQSVLRGVEGQRFYGCSSYPKCQKTSKLVAATTEAQAIG